MMRKFLLGFLLILFLSSFASAITNDDITHSYNFNGNTVDNKGNSDLTNNGATSLLSGGLIGGAYDFDGTDDYMTSVSQSINMEKDSIVIWFNISAGLGAENYIMVSDYEQTGTDTSRYRGGMNKNDGSIFSSIANGVVVGSQTNLNDGQFHSVFIVPNESGTSYSLYVDNVLEGSASYNGAYDPEGNVVVGGLADTTSGLTDGTLDIFQIFSNYSLTANDREDIHNAGAGLEYPFIENLTANESVENTAVVRQIGSTTINTPIYQTVLSSDFDVEVNNTPLYGVYTFNVLSNNANTITCRMVIGGVVKASKSRSNTAGQIGSMTLSTEMFTSENGTYTQSLECSKTGAGGVVVSNAVGVGHFMIDEFDNFINYASVNISKAVNTSGWELIVANNFTVNNVSGSNQVNNLIFEGSIEYVNNGVASQDLSTYISVGDDFNCSFYPRTVSSGSSGSVGVDCIRENVTAGSTYELSLYGKGLNANFTGNLIVKEFFMSPEEIVGGTGAIAGLTFAGATPTLLFNTSGGNFNHDLANAFNKVSYSLTANQSTNITLYTVLSNGAMYQSNDWLRFANTNKGVLIAQDVFVNIPKDADYTIQLWGVCPNANCTIEGGSGVGYITDLTTTVLNAFNVTAYDVVSGESIINFTVLNSVVVTTNTGVAQIFSENPFENLTISSLYKKGYYNKSFTNHNTSLNLNSSLNPFYRLTAAYSNFTFWDGVNMTRRLVYSLNYTCPSFYDSSLSLFVVHVFNTGLSGFTCDNSPNTLNGAFVASSEGGFNISFRFNSSFNPVYSGAYSNNRSFTADLFNPNYTINWDTTQGFGVSDFNISLTCTDNIATTLTYNLSVDRVDLIFQNSSNGSTVSNPVNFTNGYNFASGYCGDAVSFAVFNESRLFYSKNLILIDEKDNTLFNVDNITGARVYIDDNSTFYDFKVQNVSNVSFFSSLFSQLRFELLYEDGTIITRYIDVSILDVDQDLRVCANKEGTTYFEQLLISNSQRRSILKNVFSDCFVAADFIRFAYQDAGVLKAYTIDSLYYLYTFDGDNQVLLASLDGSIAAFYNIDRLEFIREGYDFSILSDTLTFEYIDENVVLLRYGNIADDNTLSRLRITNLDANQLVLSTSSFTDPNNWIVYFDVSTLSNVTDDTLFLAEVTNTKTNGDTEVVKRYFNTRGKTGTLPSGLAFTIAAFVTFFGLTLTASRITFSWFGIFILLFSIGFMTFAVSTWYILMLTVIDLIILVYAVLNLWSGNEATIS